MERDDLELFARSVRQATEAHSGEALDRALDDLGWADALDADPQAAVSVLFALQGEAAASSTSLARVLGSDVLPALGGCEAPGRLDGDALAVEGLALRALPPDRPLSVVARRGDAHVVVEVPSGALEETSVSGLDPWLGVVRVSGRVTGAGEAGPAADWSAAVARGRVALGHELAGASRRMLDLAREHALERVQFDRPIAQFQAVRHRLAETLVAIETADALLAAAWDDGTPVTAAMAKALAGRGARTTARHCQQVLAGIGFTTEHPLHRYVRRVLVLDELLGSTRTLTRELGEELLRTRALPPMQPL